MTEIIEEVERRLGFILKEKQREVIAAFVKGNDVFAVLPTEFCKTLQLVLIMQSTASSTFCECLTPISQVCMYSAETQERHIIPTYPSSS